MDLSLIRCLTRQQTDASGTWAATARAQSKLRAPKLQGSAVKWEHDSDDRKDESKGHVGG